MNDELKTKLMQYLNGIEHLANDAVMAGKQEIPQYIQELIRWEIARNALGAILAAGLILMSVLAARWAWNKREMLDEAIVLFIIFCPVGAIFGVCIFVDSAEAALKPWLAPRVFIVEKVSALVRSK